MGRVIGWHPYPTQSQAPIFQSREGDIEKRFARGGGGGGSFKPPEEGLGGGEGPG